MRLSAAQLSGDYLHLYCTSSASSGACPTFLMAPKLPDLWPNHGPQTILHLRPLLPRLPGLGYGSAPPSEALGHYEQTVRDVSHANNSQWAIGYESPRGISQSKTFVIANLRISVRESGENATLSIRSALERPRTGGRSASWQESSNLEKVRPEFENGVDRTPWRFLIDWIGGHYPEWMSYVMPKPSMHPFRL